jgi:hypothetical protein
LSSSSAVTAGTAREPPPTPTGIISSTSSQTGTLAARHKTSRPPTMNGWPATAFARSGIGREAREPARLPTAVSAVIGTNASPVASADSPRCCCRYRLSRNTIP